MDLSQLDLSKYADQGSTMDVLHPITDEVLMHDGQHVTITLLGMDSSTIRNEMKKRAQKQMNRRVKQDIDAAIEDSAELLAACTLTWSGITENGQAVECTRENCKAVYIKYTWLRQQVDAFVTDRANFFKA